MRALAFLLVAAGFSGILRAQTATPQPVAQRFDAASIRRNTSGQPVGVIATLFQLQPSGRFRIANVTLKQLVLLAYRSEITGAHLSGGPDWFDKDRFDLEAVTPPDTISPSMTRRARAELLEHLMQELLADRFRLRVRREVRQADVYAMVIAKGGPRLVSARIQNCEGPDTATLCHQTSGGVNRGLVGVSVDMADIARHLELSLPTAGERVIDRTGITGLFDVTVTWRRSEGARPDPDGPNAGRQADADGADVFTAIQEQIGLRLERQKAPVNFVIVESADRPSPN